MQTNATNHKVRKEKGEIHRLEDAREISGPELNVIMINILPTWMADEALAPCPHGKPYISYCSGLRCDGAMQGG